MKAKSVIHRGDVFTTSYVFPHERDITSGMSGIEKERPILILQDDAENADERYPLVLAAPLTTQKADRVYQQDVLLPAGEARLLQDSKVLLGMTQPFRKVRLSRQIGQVSPARMREIDLKLQRLLGLRRLGS
ncbi:MAG: type II toxin-antitoxin system PemK/MazF family toxin [Chloroflexi bacterium]|nr:type II toxin-antitoxin system PemK/MazF family toxin [Chloroflexota bacterium]